MHSKSMRQHFPKYASNLKGERARCSNCNAFYDKGRWQWLDKSSKSSKNEKMIVCPACVSIQTGDASGRVMLHGDYYLKHRGEIDNLVKNVESAEKAEHPLERIMCCNKTQVGTEVLTTGIHLARRIAKAVKSAHKGETVFRSPSPSQLHVLWQRNLATKS